MARFWDQGSTRAWRALKAQTVAEEPTCRLRLPGCTHISDTADHIIPTCIRPELALTRSNTQGACRHCNYSRGNTPISMLDEMRQAATRSTDPMQTETVARQHHSTGSRFFL